VHQITQGSQNGRCTDLVRLVKDKNITDFHNAGLGSLHCIPRTRCQHERNRVCDMEDVELFRTRLEAIERGDTIADRIRCRWKDETAGKVLAARDGLSPEQRFFVGFGQIYCENATEEASRLLAQTDTHSPGRFRVNGVVGNMPEFQRAFSCKAGQPMVREKPCRVW